jgi:hypothetical protein
MSTLKTTLPISQSTQATRDESKSDTPFRKKSEGQRPHRTEKQHVQQKSHLRPVENLSTKQQILEPTTTSPPPLSTTTDPTTKPIGESDQDLLNSF